MSYTQPAAVDAAMPALTPVISLRPVALPAPEASVPSLAGRLDHKRIAVAGHSWGATTTSPLVGARIVDEDGIVGEDMSDPRVLAGVLLAVAGTGGDDPTDWSPERIALIQQVTTAYLRSALNPQDEAWSQMRAALDTDPHPMGRLESK